MTGTCPDVKIKFPTFIAGIYAASGFGAGGIFKPSLFNFSSIIFHPN
jgi:hypothetical protein